MKPDKNTVKQLLMLSDEDLEGAIRKICDENGLDAAAIGLNKKTIGILRVVLANASDADIDNFLSALGARKGGK